MVSIVVSKSSPVVVRPSSEPVTSTGKINLSAYDFYHVGMATTAFLVFQHPIQKPAETIKWGLSRALVHYHPLSGRLLGGGGGGGEVHHISCTGNGVLFVAASANVAIEDAKLSEHDHQSLAATTTRPLLDHLAVYYPAAEAYRDSDPLVMMQVTEFSSGGFVVGVTWNHGVADGVGMGQFLQAVGELSRGLPSPSVPAVRLDDSLAVTSSNVGAVQQAYMSLQLTDNALLDFTVPSSLIGRIKDEFRRDSGGRTCTVFEAISAVLWQCRTRAVISDPKAPTGLIFPANARKYARAKDGYYGNCVTAQLVMAESGRVANGDLMELVRMIQGAKEQIPDKFSKRGSCNLEEIRALTGYDLLCVTCWRKLGFECTDFGGGVPARVMSHCQQVLALPICQITSTGKHGSCVMSGCVKDDHAHAFLAELARIN
uniref:Uncharacterized protein n=1 Tax=Avena sativa TaxID=4498 RepID=A0ACD5XWP2_AVESA